MSPAAAKAARKGAGAGRSKAWTAGRADALAGREPDESYDGGGDEFDYDRGYQAGLDEADPIDDGSARAGRDGSSGSRRDGSAKSGRKAKGKGVTKRRKTPRPVATARRRLTAPAASSTASALTALGGGIALAMTYNFLTNADDVGGALEGVAKALRWLEDPTKSIPYRSN